MRTTVDRQRWSKAIRDWLVEHKQRPYTLAKMLGVSPPIVYAWLSKPSAPSPARAQMVIALLGLDPVKVFGRDTVADGSPFSIAGLQCYLPYFQKEGPHKVSLLAAMAAVVIQGKLNDAHVKSVLTVSSVCDPEIVLTSATGETYVVSVTSEQGRLMVSIRQSSPFTSSPMPISANPLSDKSVNEIVTVLSNKVIYGK